MKIVAVSVLGIVGCFAEVCRAEDAKPVEAKLSAAATRKNPLFDRAAPEGALRLFFAGMTLGDRDVLEATMIPENEEDLQILLIAPRGQPRPTMEQTKQLCGAMKIRRLKVGEKFTMPDGKDITVGADEITDDKAVLLVEGHPIPTRMARARDQWWVDARPIIAGRKAGQAALKRAAEEEERAKEKERAK